MPEIQMPKLSDTMTEGTLVAWKKKKGDKVSTGDVIAEIETDKATMEWESPEDGVLTEIYVEEGGKVEIGQRIAFIGAEGEAAPAGAEEEKAPSAKIADKAEPEAAPPKPEKKEKAAPTPATKSEAKAAPSTSVGGDDTRVKASPLARRLAAEQGLEISKIKGSGPDGRVLEADVRKAMKSEPTAAKPQEKSTAAPAKNGEGTRIHLSGMRKVIAQRLVESKGPVPHFYLTIEINAGPLMTTRAELKAGGEGSDTAKITVNDLILKAAVAAAVKVPKVNASFDDDAIVQYQDIDLAIAVALEDGLITPVLRAAQNKSLREISEAVKDLAQRARNKRMKPEEFQGGTLTVSNLGSYGIDYFSAIINPPQAIILSIGAIVKKPVVNEDDEIVPGYRMKIGMSCDHRVVDGAIGANYLKAFRRLLENPTLLLI